MEKVLLCPDCQINTLTTDKEKENILCNSCRQRKQVSKVHDKPYIRFVDLDKSEQERILSTRKMFSERIEAKNEKKEPKKENKERSLKSELKEVKSTTKRSSKRYPPIIHEICQRDPNRTIREILDEIIREVPEYDTIQYKQIWALMENKKYPYTKGQHLGRPRTKEVIEDQISIIEESKEEIIESTPETILGIEQPELIYEEVVDENINQEEPARFIPIKKEISEILDKKYNDLDCALEYNYTTEDYIKCLEMLKYLAINVDKIIKARNNQHDILNAFQSDTVHECENVIAKEGDTYLSDKLHILRNERRYYEYDCNDIAILKNFLKTLNINDINYTLTSLKNIYEKRKSPKFIPLVDYTMIDKYDWAIAGDLDSNKKLQQPIVKSAIRKNINSTTRKNSLQKFRATCKLNGGGFGAFAPWHNDYLCTNETVARSKAFEELRALINSPQHKGAYYTDLDVYKLNQ